MKQRLRSLSPIGLGFWQAWWVVAMCTRIVIPAPAYSAQANGFDYTSFFTTASLAGTVLGYLAVALISKCFAPLSCRRALPLTAALLSGFGSLGMSSLVHLLPAGEALIAAHLFFLALFSLGNALILILWGELWSTLATGTVGRHLYLSYLFAIILFFIIRALPQPLDIIITALLLPLSMGIFTFAKELPRRVSAKDEAAEPQLHWIRALVAIALLNIAWGFYQQLVSIVAQGTNTTSKALTLAGILLGVLVVYLVAFKPEAEPLFLFKPVMPALACGMVLTVALGSNWVFVGDGIAIMGAYCLDMLIMLVACDMAHRQRIPVAWGFGFAVIVARVGSFFGNSIFLLYDAPLPSEANTWILLAALVVTLAGSFLFSDSDLKKLYQVSPPVVMLDPTLEQKCALVSLKYNLSAREEEVLVFLAHGRSGPYIGNELCIATGTVKRHISNIYRKIGVAERQSLHDIVAGAAHSEQST